MVVVPFAGIDVHGRLMMILKRVQRSILAIVVCIHSLKWHAHSTTASLNIL
jgi:hypothetical protein